MSEVMVFADDAAKVNRVMDKMNLDFVRSEVGEAVHEVTEGMDAPETVQMPEGEVQFEISDLDEAFQVGDMESSEPENFIPVQEEGEENLSGFSLHSRNISTGQENGTDGAKPRGTGASQCPPGAGEHQTGESRGIPEAEPGKEPWTKENAEESEK